MPQTILPSEVVAMPDVLLIAADRSYRARVGAALRAAGYRVAARDTGALGALVEELSDRHRRLPHLVLCRPDVDAPETLVRLLRLVSARPVVTLGGTDRAVRLLAAGATCHLPAGCPPRLLTAQLGAILRRVPDPPRPVPRQVGALHIDVTARQARLRDRILPLSRTEFDALALLGARPGQLVPRARLREWLRRDGRLPSRAAVDTVLCRLRHHLGESAHTPRYLHTVRNRGIRLTTPR